RRGARRARGRPRVPAHGRRVQRGADPHLDRLEARERRRPRAAPPAPARVRPLLRRVTTLTRIEIRDLTPLDWREVAAIYQDGIDSGDATFEAEVPSWEAWDAAHTEIRMLAELDGRVAGWGALSPYSDRACYSGVAEDSVYVSSWAQGQGVGRA